MLDPPVHLGDEWLKKLSLDLSVTARARPELIQQASRRRSIWPSRQAIREAWQDKPTFLAWTREAFDLYINEGFKDLPDGTVALKCSPEVESGVFAATAADVDMFDAVTLVTCPTLLVHARQGHFPTPIHELFAGRFQNGVFLATDAGHLMPFEDPDLCAGPLLDFARQQPSTDSSTTSIAASASIS